MDQLLTDGTWLTSDEWLGNSPLAWICAVGGAVVGFALVRLLLWVARKRIVPRAQHFDNTAARSLVAALDAVRGWLLSLLAIAIALDFLDFGATAGFWLRVVTFLLVGLQLVLCINRIIVTALTRAVHPTAHGGVPVMLGILIWACQFVVWVTFLLAVLTNAGVNITAFVASLGLGGIAVALALQTILGDLFAAVAIGLDKPFEPGDFIAFGTDSGSVVKVGVKTTRIASQSGEQLAISNSNLLSQLVRNYSRMSERRIAFGFTVPFDTSREHLETIVERTNAIISASESVRFDRGHFTGFGTDGFTFEFVYFMLDSDYGLYRDVQQQINEQIVDLLVELGVHFAVPARLPASGA